MAAPRLFVEADLITGGAVALGEGPARHLTSVLRLREGAHLRLFNGRDGEYAATIREIGKRALALTVGERLREQEASPDLLLLFAPLKRQATDWLVEKATELGVRAMQPVITKRTDVDTVRVDRLAAIAREAAEQSERLDAPDIRAPLPLARALDGWDAARPLIYADESGDDQAKPWGGAQGRGAPLFSVLPGLRADRLALLIGPEGGFDPEERRALRSLGFVIPVSLGPRILRAETAAIAALALIQAAWDARR
jgi:16S rRNA (uracil1498-N3)-methyltransferase